MAKAKKKDSMSTWSDAISNMKFKEKVWFENTNPEVFYQVRYLVTDFDTDKVFVHFVPFKRSDERNLVLEREAFIERFTETEIER